MPRFDLECPACLRTEEVILRVREDVPDCPNCDHPRVKLPSHFSFALKGGGVGGFYSKTYAKGGGRTE